MKEVKLVEALIANGFEVIKNGFMNVRYEGKFILAMDGKSVLRNYSVIETLPKVKQKQLDYLIKKYQGLLEYDSVVEF